MARTRLIISGVPGIPPQVVPLTPAEDAEHDFLEAVHAKRLQFSAEALVRIKVIVPAVQRLREIAQLSRGDILTNASLRKCRQILSFIEVAAKKKLRAKVTVAAVNAIKAVLQNLQVILAAPTTETTGGKP